MTLPLGWYIHINRNTINSNRTQKKNDAPIKFQYGKYGKATYAHRVKIDGPSELIYSSEGTLLPCGARLVIFSETEPKVLE